MDEYEKLGTVVHDPASDPYAGLGEELKAKQGPTPSGYKAVSETGPGERFLVGLGKTVSDVGTGLQERYLEAKRALGLGDTSQSLADLQKQIEFDRARTAAVTRTPAGVAGQIAGTTALATPAMFIPGAQGAVGAGLIGGAMGLAEPTAGDESVAGNVAKGVVGGVVGQQIGQRLPGIVKGVIDRFGQKANPAQIEQQIIVNLHNQGIDWSALDKATQDSLRQATADALKVGATVNPAEQARLAAFKELGVTPTQGQLTQDPVQFGNELFLREKRGGEELAGQYQNTLRAMNERLQKLISGTGQEPVNAPTAGGLAMAPLEQAAERGQTLVNRAYDRFKQAVPEDAAVDAQTFANNFFDQMQREPGLRNLPKSLVSTLNDFSTGRVPKVNLVDAEAINQEISRQLTNASPAEKFALGKFKNYLDDQIHGMVQSAAPRDSEAARRLLIARKFASERFGEFDKIPALKAAAEGNVAPDDFVRKFVTGSGPDAKVADIQHLKEFYQQTDPAAWNQIKAQVLSDIAEKASRKEGQFLQSQFNKELASLERSGKLGVLFDHDEIHHLNLIGKVGAALEGPQGVSRTGLAGAAKATDLLGKFISHLGGTKVGTVANAVIGPAVTSVKAAGVLKPTLAGNIPAAAVSVPAVRGLQGLGTVAGIAAGSPDQSGQGLGE